MTTFPLTLHDASRLIEDHKLAVRTRYNGADHRWITSVVTVPGRLHTGQSRTWADSVINAVTAFVTGVDCITGAVQRVRA